MEKKTKNLQEETLEQVTGGKAQCPAYAYPSQEDDMPQQVCSSFSMQTPVFSPSSNSQGCDFENEDMFG